MADSGRAVRRRPRHNRTLMVLAGTVIAVLLAACGGSGSSGQEGATLVFGTDVEPSVLNPALLDTKYPAAMMIFDGLTAHGPNGKVTPRLATDWQISADARTYTFDLRRDVRWSDGKPFTARDVVFTIKAIKDPANAATAAPGFAPIKSVTALDDHRVRIALSQPFAPLLDKLSLGILPAHLLAGTSLQNGQFNNNPIGTGPYRLEEWQHGQFMTLVSNPRYYGRRPAIRKVVFKFVTDASSRLVQLRAGQLDGAVIEPNQVRAVKQLSGARVIDSPTADYRALMFNFKKDEFADARVRKAISASIDRKALVQSVLLGYGRPASGPLDRTRFALTPPAVAPTAQPRRATSLMRAAGWTRENGFWTRDSARFSFKIQTFADDPVRVATSQVLTTQLRRAGFDVQSEPLESGYVLNNWRKLDTFIIGWGSPYDPDNFNYAVFTSGEVLDKGGENFGSYVDPVVDHALEAGRTTMDPAGRKQAYLNFQRALSADPPYAFLFYVDALKALPVNLHGYTPDRLLSHHGLDFFYNVAKWRYGSS